MKQGRLSSTQLGLIIIVGILGILFLILIIALGIFLVTTGFNPTQSDRPSLLINQIPVDTDRIDPALALTSLGGVPEEEVIREAISKSRPETALAVLLFDPELSDEESAGAFVQLASLYKIEERQDKALFCYKMAGTIATLSPNIINFARADLFIQVGEGLIELEERDLAKFYLDQAFTLATHSPFLQIVHRRSIFERLQKNYLQLGERELARVSLDLSADPPDIELIVTQGALLPEKEVIFYPPQVQEIEADRWIKAQELAALYVERGGSAPKSAQEALKNVLLLEDEQKLLYYNQELTSEAQLSRQIDLTLAKIEWLSIKYRISKGAFGLDLVPEWTEQSEQIRADLTKTYQGLYTLYADLAVALPQVSAIDKATEERLRREVLAGELRRYPNYPEQQRKKQLLDIVARLRETQPELNVFINIIQIAEQDLFTFSPPTGG